MKRLVFSLIAVTSVLADGPKDKEWQRIVLDDTLIDGHALACHDLLGLGNRQIVVGWRAEAKLSVAVGAAR
jgi:hypothetical protein